MRKQMTVLAYTDPIGKVSKETVSGHLMIGYDDLYSIQYFQDNRMPIGSTTERWIFIRRSRKGRLLMRI